MGCCAASIVDVVSVFEQISRRNLEMTIFACYDMGGRRELEIR